MRTPQLRIRTLMILVAAIGVLLALGIAFLRMPDTVRLFFIPITVLYAIMAVRHVAVSAMRPAWKSDSSATEEHLNSTGPKPPHSDASNP
jgi:hypothetical protein